MSRQDISRFPLGACVITFDATENGASAPVVLAETLEDQDTQLITSTEVYKVMVDQLAGALIAQHISGDEPVTVTCSEIMKESQLPDLTAIWVKHASRDAYAMDPHSKAVMWGTLRVHPVAMGEDTSRDFFGPKVMCRPEVVGNFKNQDQVMVEFTFEFSAMDDISHELYGKILTVGDYATPENTPVCVLQPISDLSVTAGVQHELLTEWENADTFQWFFDDNTGSEWRPIDDGGTFTGCTTKDLTINAMATSTIGRYYCRAKSGELTKDTNVAIIAMG